MQDALQLFVSDKDNPETARAYESVLSKILLYLETFGISEIEEVEPIHLSQYIADLKKRDVKAPYRSRKPTTPRKLSPVTINREVKFLKIFFNFLEPLRLTPNGNPASHLRGTSTRRKNASDKMITTEEIQLLLNVAYGNPFLYALIMFFATTGARRGEVCYLRMEDVHLDEGTAIIRKGKTGYRQIWYPSDTVEALSAWLAVRPDDSEPYLFVSPRHPHNGYLPRSLGKVIYRLAQKAGIDRPLHTHCFRHYYATESLRSGLDIKIVAEAIGDDPKTVLEHYIHATKEDVKSAMQQSHLMRNINSNSQNVTFRHPKIRKLGG